MTRYRQGRSGLYVPSNYRSAPANVVRFGTLKIWAEEGLVCYVVDCPDSPHNGQFGSLHPDQAERRFKKILQGAGKTTDLGGTVRDSQGLRDLSRIADGLHDVIRQAREQGPSRIITKKDLRGAPNVRFQRGQLVELDQTGKIERYL
ncbi:MAG: hypothetical protein KatS3mg109_0138 [Pirellulaceae bacterium]|nr:MAG: hypothetical protein KatS3mg109_0138 [Pirellulaceae bacterium]